VSVGVGWRSELAADLLARPDAVDLVELTAEGCTTAAATREARAVAEVWPVVVHGVKTSLGSAEGLDGERARRLAQVARAVGAPCVSEHVSFVRAGGVEIGHLTGLPFTRDAVRAMARNVAKLRRVLPDVPLLLENVAWSFRWPEDVMDEGDFHREVTEATGCDLLLDVGNLYANAVNAGRDPGELLARYPLDRVAMVHVAGGVWEEGFYFDTHAHAVPEPVMDLAARVLSEVGDVPVVLERDAAFPPFAALGAELQRARVMPRGRAGAPLASSARAARAVTAPQENAVADERMQEAQRLMAILLTTPEDAVEPAVHRARGILHRKRADDALPLLPSLAALGEPAHALARQSLQGVPRPPSRVAVHDALRIADAARDDGPLRDAARADALLLRARFVVRRGLVRPRVGPYVERARMASGATRWVFKGPGPSARVHVVERRGAP
jgi:uncharacterized protein (UPF0276 family)